MMTGWDLVKIREYSKKRREYTEKEGNMWKNKVKSHKKEGLKKVLSIYQKNKEIDIKNKVLYISKKRRMKEKRRIKEGSSPSEFQDLKLDISYIF